MFNLISEGLSNIDFVALAIAIPLVALLLFIWQRLTHSGFAHHLGKPAHKVSVTTHLLAVALLAAALGHVAVLINPDMTGYDQSYARLLLFTACIALGNSAIAAMNYVYEGKGFRYWLITETPIIIGLLLYGLLHAYLYQSANPETNHILRVDVLEVIARIPWLAVGIAYIIFQVVGALWYSKFLFGNIWAQEMGIPSAQLEKGMPPKSIILSMLFSAIAFVLLSTYFSMTIFGLLGAILVGPPVALVHALLVGIWCVYEKRSIKAWFIKAVFPAVGIIILALLFGWMRM